MCVQITDTWEMHQLSFHHKLEVFICQAGWFPKQVHCCLPGFLVWADRSQSNRSMASTLYLCTVILRSGMWGDEKEWGAWVRLKYTRTFDVKIKPDPCWGLKSFIKFPSCFPSHALCFVCLILWLHGSHEIGSKAVLPTKAGWAFCVPDWAKPKKRWKYPLPARICKISSLIARPNKFGVICGPPWFKPL